MDARLVIFIHFIVHHTASGQNGQTCACKIVQEDFTADCSGMELTNISSILDCLPNTIRELRLNGNKISDIPPRTFKKLYCLQTLRLDYNTIEYLKSGAFEGLSDLENLYLNYNMLKYDNSYEEDVFEPLHDLRRLFIQGNCDVRHFQCQYPDKVLSALHSLEHLHLDGIPNTFFGTGFAQLAHLHSLYLDNANGYCSMPVLTQNTFKSFRQTPLSYLNMNGCNIRHLSPNTFRGLRNLTTLIILGNIHLCSDSLENATLGLNETKIETIKFNDWCRRPPYFPMLLNGNFQGLTNTSLKSLDLGWNNIYYVDPTVIKNLPTSVKYISFKRNGIQRAEFLKEFARLDSLSTLDISYQSYYNAVEPATKRKRKSLKKDVVSKELHLEATNVGDILFENKSSLHFLALKNGTKGGDIVHLPENLQTLHMNNIKLGYPLPPLRFSPNKLQYLDASHCMLQAFLGPFYGLKYLKVLNLSYNRFGLFNKLSLIDMQNLSSLSLQSNAIGKSLYLDTKGITFSSLRKLTELDLSSNIIKELPYDIFKNQISLRKLSLADNSLQTVSFSLKYMKKLQHLDLSDNVIKYISNENMDFLDQVRVNIYLNLSGNIFTCTCGNQQFIYWLATTKVNIVEKDRLLCTYRNDTVVSLSRIEMILMHLKYECTSWIVITSCVIAFLCLFLLFSLVALFYHKRWQMRYLWYIGRIKIDPFHHPEDQLALPEIDAYISYEQHYDVTNDITLHQLITDKFYPFFQQQGYKTQIREEFDGNEKLYHSIPKAIRKSRKVIVMLTVSYCEDYWNTFEFNIAAYEGIYTKRSIIIPVLIGDISDEHLTPEICSFIRSKIKSNEVLRFPAKENLESHIDAFKEQLTRCIRH